MELAGINKLQETAKKRQLKARLDLDARLDMKILIVFLQINSSFFHFEL